MKTKLERILMSLFVVTLFSSCSTLKVKFSTNDPGKINEVALISTYLGIQLPVTPLIDAAIMNEKTNSIAPEINRLFSENIDIMRETVAKLLQEKLKWNVIYGEALHSSPGFTELKEKYNFKSSLLTGKENFPEIVTAKDDINPFEFTDTRKTQQFFKNPQNYTNTIIRICEILKVDYIAVTQSLIYPLPGGIILPARLPMFTYFYLFDKNGNSLVSGSNYLKQIITYKASDPEGFERVLDTYPEIITPIMEQIAVKYGK
jgi:hypothetical protein